MTAANTTQIALIPYPVATELATGESEVWIELTVTIDVNKKNSTRYLYFSTKYWLGSFGSRLDLSWPRSTEVLIYVSI